MESSLYNSPHLFSSVSVSEGSQENCRISLSRVCNSCKSPLFEQVAVGLIDQFNEGLWIILLLFFYTFFGVRDDFHFNDLRNVI